jgi:hypothetical protein
MVQVREIKATVPQTQKELRECLHPLILKLEISKEEITAFLNDGRKVSIPLT